MSVNDPSCKILTGMSKNCVERAMKITSKGQVTIPQELRERAGLMPGCEVEFSEARDGRVFIKKLTGASRGRSIVDRLRGQGSVKMTTEEILDLTRGR